MRSLAGAPHRDFAVSVHLRHGGLSFHLHLLDHRQMEFAFHHFITFREGIVNIALSPGQTHDFSGYVASFGSDALAGVQFGRFRLHGFSRVEHGGQNFVLHFNGGHGGLGDLGGISGHSRHLVTCIADHVIEYQLIQYAFLAGNRGKHGRRGVIQVMGRVAVMGDGAHAAHGKSGRQVKADNTSVGMLTA